MHVPILKVEIAVPKEKWKKLLNTLSYWGNFHIEEYTGEHRFPLSKEEEEERKRARKILSLISEVEAFFGELEDLPVESQLDLEKVQNIRSEVVQVGRQLQMLEEERKRLLDYLALSEALPEGNPLVVILGRGEIAAKGLLFELLEKLGLSYTERMVDGKVAVIVDVQDKNHGDVENTLVQKGFTLLKPPKGYANLNEVRKALQEILPKRIEELRHILKELKEKYANFLRSQKFVARDLLNLFRWKEKSFSASRFLAFVKGWIPAHRLSELKTLLHRVDPDAFIKTEEPQVAEYENVPVALQNRPPLSWFQSLLDVYAPPVYKTFDPTLIIALFFPLYYGFMLGDAGYGIVGMFLFWVLSRVTKPGSQGHNLSMVYFINSLITVIFGLIFGEIFGDWGIKMGIIEPLFHRTHNIMDLLFIAIGFGFFQILLSMLIGVWNNWVLRHIDHALFELGRFFAILGIFFLIVSNLGAIGMERPWLKSISAFSSILTPLGAASFVIGAILVFIGETKSGGVIKGLVGQIEIFSAFGNVLSYARLTAVGLASAMLAEVANHFADMIPMPLFAITVVVAFHLLAFILGIVDPTIQGMRLQFVEAFTKFFLPASRIFTPIRKGGRI
ncbi:MAG: hypothetical protein GXO39_09990 [Thermotogae bacterium]|nr:hypothetical protein [Thermotogota bacterium]